MSVFIVSVRRYVIVGRGLRCVCVYCFSQEICDSGEGFKMCLCLLFQSGDM